MRHRQLGKTGIEVSAVAPGATEPTGSDSFSRRI